jgi:hypothetical protein
MLHNLFQFRSRSVLLLSVTIFKAQQCYLTSKLRCLWISIFPGGFATTSNWIRYIASAVGLSRMKRYDSIKPERFQWNTLPHQNIFGRQPLQQSSVLYKICSYPWCYVLYTMLITTVYYLYAIYLNIWPQIWAQGSGSFYIFMNILINAFKWVEIHEMYVVYWVAAFLL